MTTPWHIIKSVSAHIGADYGYQSCNMAQRKCTHAPTRCQHVAIVGLSHLAAAATSQSRCWWRIGLYVAINTISHYLIDSCKRNKAVDQGLHLATCLATAGLLKASEK